MILDIFDVEKKSKLMQILNRLSIEKIGEFKDPSFSTLEEATEYEIMFKDKSPEEAELYINSRNFCDLELIMSLEKLHLVECMEENYFQITYRLTPTGIELIREEKLNNILE
jgi:hypothetical protein